MVEIQLWMVVKLMPRTSMEREDYSERHEGTKARRHEGEDISSFVPPCLRAFVSPAFSSDVIHFLLRAGGAGDMLQELVQRHRIQDIIGGFGELIVDEPHRDLAR